MRTFIAAPLTLELLQKLAVIQRDLKKLLSADNLRPSWVRPEGMHLTLRFLGEIEESLAEPICQRVETVCRSTAAFDLQVKGLGTFPNAMRPRVLWVGLYGDNRISDLAAQIKSSLIDLPLQADDKPFKPHLTLARIKEPSAGSGVLKRIIDERHNEEIALLPVREIRLYRSHLKSSGAEYEVLKAFKLSE